MATPVRYHIRFLRASLAISWPSRLLLLMARFGLPLPLFSAEKVGVSASQFGQSKRRLRSVLFLQFPSIWSAINGALPVDGLISDHPQTQHLFPYFSRKYRFTAGVTIPVVVSPLSAPDFQALILFWYSRSRWHVLLQYV